MIEWFGVVVAQLGGAVAWLDTHAAAVQALAALGTLVLTVVLVRATNWYAKSAHDQTRELRLARTAAVAPYVRVTGIRIEHNAPSADPAKREEEEAWGEPSTAYARLQLALVNLGAGPAIGVRFRARGLPPGLDFEGPPMAPNMAVGDSESLSLFINDSHYAAFMNAIPASWPSELTYTDLLERNFLTRFRVHVTRGPGGEHLEVRFDERMQFVFDEAESTRNA